MRRRNKIISACGSVLILMGLAALVTSCITNDLPYPRIEQFITGIEARGEIRPADIDTVDFKATVYLDETVNIRKVEFSRFSVTPGAEVSPDLSIGSYDLSTPIVVTLSKYQEYDWIVTAVQEIKRYFIQHKTRLQIFSPGANNSTSRDKFSAQAIFSYHGKRRLWQHICLKVYVVPGELSVWVNGNT